ncbi:MAG: hypothetical protein IH991_20360 [Planctomycetes bacterium]|nr:hypothetical protein [Planctomycetota bacterium]
MQIRCICPSCDTHFKVDEKYVGKKARCPKCAAVVAVAKQAKSLDDAIYVFPTDDVEPFSAIDDSTAPMSKPKTASTDERLLAAKPLSAAESELLAVDSNTKTVELPAGFPLIDTDAKPPSAGNKETQQHEKSATSVRRPRRGWFGIE